MATLLTRRNIDLVLQSAALFAPDLETSLVKSLGRTLFRRAEDRYLLSRSPENLGRELLDLISFIRQRSPDQILIRVFNPSEQTHGYALERTVVETCMRDQPFLLDTLRLLYRNRNIREFDCLHPIVVLCRDDQGAIERVGPAGVGEVKGHKESVMHFELERIEDPQKLRALQEAITARLVMSRAVSRDFKPMLYKVSDMVDELLAVAYDVPERRDEAEEAAAFLRWLKENNFVFMGYEELDLSDEQDGGAGPRATRGLGLFRAENGVQISQPSLATAYNWLRSDDLIYCGKDEGESSIHRAGKRDVILVRRLDSDGKLSGVRVLSGLFTHKGVSQDGAGIPILRRRLKALLDAQETIPGSHHHKAVVTAFNSIPVEYLFGADLDALRKAVELIISAENHHDSAVAIRVEGDDRAAVVLCSMPWEHYDEQLRKQIGQTLKAGLKATYLDHRVVPGELHNVIVLFYVTSPVGLDRGDLAELESRLLQMARPWTERVSSVLQQIYGVELARVLGDRYLGSFPEAYRLQTSSDEGAADIGCLEHLREKGLTQIRIDPLPHADGHIPTYQLKTFQRKNVYLTDSMPVLDNFGLTVIDQTSTDLQIGDEKVFLDAFRVTIKEQRADLSLETLASNLADGLREVLGDEMDDDGLNALVVRAGLTYQQVDVIRAYIGYLRQVDNIPLAFLRRVWLNHQKAARLLIEYFEIKFDPAIGPNAKDEQRRALLELRRSRFDHYLQSVESAAEDRVLRGLFRVVDGTLRTNYFRRPKRSFLSLKLDSTAIHGPKKGLRPFREIFVHHHEVEGIHLRGGRIARGGLRWSDRYDDYRTEILDLMLTQMVKNTLIVPVGAKGGFILKRQFDDRQAERAHADQMYMIFIRGLLDVTDNRVDGRIVHPDRVLAWDGEDHYLVVAADKGTAHLSDAANSISQEYCFWLGDAFASGGSHGYDHKREGITAKGAWEGVKRHFRELGVNPERDPVRCIGIGDMSGDVFGNGMLLSRTLRLHAAFNHLHVFLDPHPDPEVSYRERERLFALPRSSWEDYDRTLISPGGGVFRRGAKAIELSPQARALLGTESSVVSGEGLVRLILRLDVDLLWSGGIGTYVKATHESHAAVGDKMNQAVRIDACDLRVRVLGEGGNLGLTHAARVQFAKGGGRINTDAVDNSGGVDMSDHEVNLKILFQPIVAAKRLSYSERDRLGLAMTDDVARRVLEHNYTQTLLVSLDQLRSRADVTPFIHFIQDLEVAMNVDLEVEGIPDRVALEGRRRAGEGLYRPELAKLAAYAKMRAQYWLLKDKRLVGAFFDDYLIGYFPEAVRTRFREEILAHPLRREIITTMMVNQVIDSAGITFFQTVHEDTGHSLSEIAMSYLISSEVLGARRLKEAIFSQDTKIPSSVQYQALMNMEDALLAHTRRTLRRYDVFDAQTVIDGLKGDFQDLHLTLADVLPPHLLEELAREYEGYKALGIPETMAREFANFRFLSSGSDIALLSQRGGVDLPTTAWIYHRVSEESRVRAVLDLTWDDENLSRWEKSAMTALRGRLIDLQYQMTLEITREVESPDRAREVVDTYLEKRQGIIARLLDLEQRISEDSSRGVGPAAVLTATVEELVR